MTASKVIIRRKKTLGKIVFDGDRTKLKNELEALFPNVSPGFLMWAATKEPYLFALFKSHLSDPKKAHNMWLKKSFSNAQKIGIPAILERMKMGEAFYEIINTKKKTNQIGN